MQVLKHHGQLCPVAFHRASYGKNIRINRTSKTSARMMKRDDKTTEFVAARPTPAVPPVARIPWKQAIRPMIRPNTAVLMVGARKSLKVAFLKPVSKNKRNEIGSLIVLATQPMTIPEKSAARVSRGSTRVHARTRGATRNR